MESVFAKSWGELDESNIWREYRTVANGLWDQGFTLLQDVCTNPTFHTARHFVYILEWDMYHLDTSWKELQNFVMFFIG
jgi:hypothetical protein